MSVTYQRKDRVAIITIERPGRRNAIDLATARALGAAWKRFDADDDAYVGILYGAGGHFSAGADLKSFDLEDTDDGPLGFTRTEVGKPTIGWKTASKLSAETISRNSTILADASAVSVSRFSPRFLIAGSLLGSAQYWLMV